MACSLLKYLRQRFSAAFPHLGQMLTHSIRGRLLGFTSEPSTSFFKHSFGQFPIVE